MQKGQGDKEQDANTRYWQGTGPTVEDGRGGEEGVLMEDTVRERKVNLKGRDLGPTGT